MTTLTVPARFCGPPASGNGGWTAGALAALVAGAHPGTGAVTVTLRLPPPLDEVMQVGVGGDGALRVLRDGALVAEGAPASIELSPAPWVPLEEARAASAAYVGHTRHPFPTCVGCGTAREDGLRVFPGPVLDGVVAGTWTPDDDVDVAVVWTAIDCISAWSADIADRAMVLGRMTAAVTRMPTPGEELVVVGETRGEDGRKITTAASLYDADGTLVATAEHLWIVVDPARFGAS